MFPYHRAVQSDRDKQFALPSEELRIAVTFQPAGGGVGPTKFNPALSSASVGRLLPDPLAVDRAIYLLQREGFRLTQRGGLSVSMRGTRELFERTFGTALSEVQTNPREDYAFQSFYYPAQGAPWTFPQRLADVIDDAYIQWPHIYMASSRWRALGARSAHAKLQRGSKGKMHPRRVAAKSASLLDGAPGAAISPTPPKVHGYYLNVPDGVCGLLNVSKVHAQRTTGKGVRVVMVDTGFVHSHPWFASRNFNSTVDLAPHAMNDATDPNGHGTGESANLLSVAPGATFIGVKVDNDSDPRDGASMLEGFQQALSHQPQIISLSMGYDLRNTDDNTQLNELPNSMAALEAEIQAAIAKGIVVVFSAGNGHFSFPGMMPEVISAGGVFVDQDGNMQASDYASAFHSEIYSGRSVPDFCGLVGMKPRASYIMLPIPPGSEIDVEFAQPGEGGPGDGTTSNDGWGVFSGTSAAAPQLAGVCALLLEKNPGLTPSDVKAILRRTAVGVVTGAANPSSSDDGVGEPAGPGDTGAAGGGLVDAFAAWQQV